MSLPASFQSDAEYFEAALSFLKKFKHYYNFANTNIFTENILDYVSTPQKCPFDENFNLESVEELNELLEKLEELTVKYEMEVYDVGSEGDYLCVPVSTKKRHEINNLSEEIHRRCREINCELVVDFGCGLGYLDQLLHEKYKYKVLGIESSKCHVKAAERRQKTYHNETTDKVKYLQHKITGESYEAIGDFIEQHFPETERICIIGLHSCADLTIEAINIFLKMEKAKGIILMPCCYHKMSKSDNDRFKYFPLSEKLKAASEMQDGGQFMRVPFLRLATQPPCFDDDLKVLVFRLLSRAILELYCHKHGMKLVKKKRRAVKLSSQIDSFSTYIEDATTNGYSLTCKECCHSDNFQPKKCDCKLQFDIKELHDMWQQCDSLTFRKAAILVLIQRHLQPGFENLVLFDRAVYLRENAVSCSFIKIADEKISPRCLALVALKC